MRRMAMVAVLAVVALGACKVKVNDEGELPKVDVEGGKMPDIDVSTDSLKLPKVDLPEVKAPDIDLPKVDLPKVDVDVGGDRDTTRRN
jgi:hypothetical protein